jgi:calcium-dependent protein kinase
MLSGKSPFEGQDETEIIKRITEEALTFPMEDWQENSSQVKDLLRQMLSKDPLSRISAKDALKHPWFNLPQPEE